MTQQDFDFGPKRPVVVFRVREDERIEVCWPNVDLYTTFADWKIALEMVLLYELNAQMEFTDASVRVRT